VLLVFTALTACKKKNDAKSKTELLTSSAWLVSKSEEKLNNNPYVDDFPNWASCEKDNKIIFATNNVVTFDEGATKCDVSDPQTETGSWAFTENDTKLIVDGETLTIEQLDENTLIVVSSYSFSGQTYTNRTTLRH
jgi:hypothetical protein